MALRIMPYLQNRNNILKEFLSTKSTIHCKEKVCTLWGHYWLYKTIIIIKLQNLVKSYQYIS